MIFFRLTLESFYFAWNALRSNPFRTILSLAGVTVGIFVIIAVFTFVDSLENSIKSSFTFLGANNINVDKWEYSFEADYPWWKYINRPNPTYFEYDVLQQNLTRHKAITILASREGVTLKHESNSHNQGILVGIEYGHQDVYNIPVSQGRYFSATETNMGMNVALIGAEIAETLFASGNPLGGQIKLNGLKYTVIGVLEREGKNLLGTPSNDVSCLIPYKSFNKIFYSGKWRGIQSTITVKGHEEDEGLKDLEGEITGLMRKLRGLKPTEEDNFALNRPEALANVISSVFAIVTLAGAIIGGCAIAVGAFGIANIMFVSVQERIPIIGIQKAVGAKNYFIMLEFLFESMFLSVIGGAIGLFMVYLITFIQLGSLEVGLSIKNIMIGFIISSTVGLLAGLIPAYKASRLDPVVAIRT